MPCFSTGRYFAKLLKLKNVELTHVKGFTYLQSYDLTKEGFESDKVKQNDQDEVQQDKELLEE